jgi:hypothetical protein
MPLTPAQVQQAQKANAQRHIQQQSHERRAEKSFLHADNKVERVIVNFTKIPEKMLEGLLTFSTEGITGPKNHTDLNDPEIKKKMESNIDSQDNKEASLADIRRQLSFLKEEENNARHSMDKEKKEHEQVEAEEERKKAYEEQQQNRQAPIMATPKQKRGVMGQKRKKSVETNAAQGKQ